MQMIKTKIVYKSYISQICIYFSSPRESNAFKLNVRESDIYNKKQVEF